MTRTRLSFAAAVAAITVALAACAPAAAPADHPDQPDRPFDAAGVLATFTDGEPNPGEEPILGAYRLTVEDDAYVYFTDASLLMQPDTPLADDAGASVARADLRAGMRVQVWTDFCMESYPVQCNVVFLRVTGGA